MSSYEDSHVESVIYALFASVDILNGGREPAAEDLNRIFVIAERQGYEFGWRYSDERFKEN